MKRHPLLESLVDYAGLFPPASLDLPAAVREYADHRKDPEAWMLGHFICPVGRLSEVLPFAALFPEESPLSLSLLPGPGESAAERVSSAVAAFAAFAARFDGATTLAVLELRLSDDLPTLSDLLGVAHQAADSAVFVEWAPHLPDMRRRLELIQAAREQGAGNLGAKIRCGGTEVSAFPSVHDVARFIRVCASLNIPFKATAGLHHPVRHDRDGFTMHGFLNVFGAAVLARNGLQDQEALESILAERDPTAFSLAGGGFAWRTHAVTAAQITDARHMASAYGSCSFSEPLEDLDAARWFGFRTFDIP
jgi:hypothetical protein